MARGHYGPGVTYRPTKKVISKVDDLLALRRRMAALDKVISQEIALYRRRVQSRKASAHWEKIEAMTAERNEIALVLFEHGFI